MAFNFQGGPALAMGQAGMMAAGGVLPAGMIGPMAGMIPSGFQMPLISTNDQGPSQPSQPSQQQPPPQQSQQPPSSLVNPGLNDAPLEFNMNKNKPPMALSNEERSSQFQDDKEKSDSSRNFKRKERERRQGKEHLRDRSKEDKDRRLVNGSSMLEDQLHPNQPAGMELSSGSPAAPVWPGILPGMPYQMMGVPLMDPNMMMPQFGVMGGMGVAPSPEMTPDGGLLMKEVIQLKSVTLVPPPPGTPLPSTRERPPGCKTIFVGGLAENTTEDVIKEIFSRCGEMLTVRLSNKKFCHIRFVHEHSVDSALYFSGYRMRIENKTDPANTGRLHVDFAQARDDQYEWECKQRQLQREARHRDRVEKERLRVPSPPPVPHYTEHEATSVSDKIKAEDSFGKAVQVVITWLERGDCNKRNASVFYSMIQSTNSHIRRLLTEKAVHEEELQKAKDLMKARMQSLLLQYAQIERVFTAASHKKVWDHFTKAQRKNIEMWKKQAAEIKAVELEEHLNSGGDDEMDFSDEDDVYSGNSRKKSKINDDRLQTIKEENDSLRCQLEAYKNEIDLVKSELKAELTSTESRLNVAQQTIVDLQKRLTEARLNENKEHSRALTLEGQLAQAQAQAAEVKEDSTVVSSLSPSPQTGGLKLAESDARLIGLISMFLHVHPFGAGVDYIWSYIQKIEPGIKPVDIENLLGRFPSLFQQQLSGIGANMERKWIISVFHPVIPT